MCPVTLYLVVPPSDINRTKPLIRLILNQIGRRLTEEAQTVEMIAERVAARRLASRPDAMVHVRAMLATIMPLPIILVDSELTMFWKVLGFALPAVWNACERRNGRPGR